MICMFVILFDFLFEDCCKLIFWFDIVIFLFGFIWLEEEWMEYLFECLIMFIIFFKECQFEGNESQDFIFLLVNNFEIWDMDGVELLGNLIFLIVGGNDMIWNLMLGGVWFMY